MPREPGPKALSCEGDEGCSSSQFWYCDDCNSFFCDDCWPKQGPHRTGKVARDGIPHEKTNHLTVERLKAILQPAEDLKQLKKLHRHDTKSTWFGVLEEKVFDHSVPGSKTRHKFREHGRFASLMAHSRASASGTQYPQLVSFVGQTNAGKSTLIKMLIELFVRDTVANSKLSSPVVGSAKFDKVPTSGDVHLYADLATHGSPLPILFADCEGLDGGNKDPIAVRVKNSRKTKRRTALNSVGTTRDLSWAQDGTTQARSFAVAHLYPRLLAFESTALTLLLDWAAKCLEMSINQPTLPHAIIALNATDLDVDESEWDVGKATENLMNLIAPDIKKLPRLQENVQMWQKRGRKIKTTRDLIHCYYSSISIVRIPVKGRYPKIQTQVTKLRDEIGKKCGESYRVRTKARMLSNTDQLHAYLQAGFDHFASTLDKPFNFLDINVLNDPIPQHFGDHLLNAVHALHDIGKKGLSIFSALSPMLASSLLLQCVRQNRPGSVIEFFNKHYRSRCKAALERYCDEILPCEYHDPKGRVCQNVKSRHSAKGHQDDQGAIFGTGNHQSSFSADVVYDGWMKNMVTSLTSCEEALQEKHQLFATGVTDFELEDAFKMHVRRLEQFTRGHEEHFKSLLTCYGCLMGVPRHPLPCGHALCSACVKSYGVHDANLVLLKNCPLHPAQIFEPAWVVKFKPDFAGVRVLSLDGGGVRGILELEILKGIENALGGELRIQTMFDLIVGTSTGGIIALGLGAKQWPLNECIENFVETCDSAFTPRGLAEVKGLRQVIALRHGSIYKTSCLQNMLKNKFEENFLFGGTQTDNNIYDTHVAVMTTSGDGSQPIALTNYSRQENNGSPYRLQFSYGGHPNMRIWEAACATSAAPTFFKPFIKATETLRETYCHSYLDGALYHNNPVRVAADEARALWPDVADQRPDIVLSIGTGQEVDEEENRKFHDVEDRQKIRDPPRKSSTNEIDGRNSRWPIEKMLKILMTRMDKALDADLIWDQYHNEVAGPDSDPKDAARYIRMNQKFKGQRPQLDAKAQLRTMQDRLAKELRLEEYPVKLQRIAYRLVASTFYFEKKLPKYDDVSKTYNCRGAMCCRYQNDSQELRALGRFFKSQQITDFQPYFQIGEKSAHSPEENVREKIEITSRIIDTMCDRAVFNLGRDVQCKMSSAYAPTVMSLCLYSKLERCEKSYPISGFPRLMIKEHLGKCTFRPIVLEADNLAMMLTMALDVMTDQRKDLGVLRRAVSERERQQIDDWGLTDSTPEEKIHRDVSSPSSRAATFVLSRLKSSQDTQKPPRTKTFGAEQSGVLDRAAATKSGVCTSDEATDAADLLGMDSDDDSTSSSATGATTTDDDTSDADDDMMLEGDVDSGGLKITLDSEEEGIA
ncbi:MAG: hypothetical protein M1828_007058 [Chrysothrix sp. TS-e1954]|nr:MAG: hypothetical protein M1828_007058 [Chrysothrix sp. TS-e1954]